MKEDMLGRLSKKLFDFSCGVAGMQADASLEGMDGPLWHRVVATAVQAAARTETDPFDESSEHLISWYEDARKAMTETHCLLKVIQKMGLLPKKKEAKKLLELSRQLMYEVNSTARSIRQIIDEEQQARYDEFAESMKEAMEEPEAESEE